MSDSKAYVFDRHERAVTIRGVMKQSIAFAKSGETEGVAQCDAVLKSLDTPIPTAQEFVTEVMRRYDTDDTFDLHDHFHHVAAELGITIDKESSDE